MMKNSPLHADATGAKEILLGVTGSIGAYKAADLVRRLKEQACALTVVMTKEACQFIAPLTLQALSERTVHTDLFSLEGPAVIHTTLADQAKLVLIAPATANIIAKLANGLADDLLTCVVLATKAPVLIAPAMNVQMYEHPMVQENIKRLRRLGYHFVGPQVGRLACGYDAIGHLAEVETIVQAALQLVAAVRRPAPQRVQGNRASRRGARRPSRRTAVRRR